MPNTESTSLFHSTEEDYWKSYLEARPKYSQDLFERLVAYRSAHAQTRDVAIDIGGGAGQASEALGKYFDHVVLNDINEEHVQVARDRLAYLGNRASFLTCKGESVDEHLLADYADLVLVAECIPLMDTTSALASWHKVLRPGGTLAVLWYGRTLFTTTDGTDLDSACNVAYTNLINKVYGDLTDATLAKAPASKAFFQRSWDMQNSRLDNVQISAEAWSDVCRVYWNSDGNVEFAMWDLEESGIKKNYISHVGRIEKLEKIQDRSLWAEDWGTPEVKRYLSFLMPGIDTVRFDHDAEYARLFNTLQQALGGPEGKRSVTWPVVLILATKK